MPGLPLSLRNFPGAGRVWLRNAAVWRKTWRTSLVGTVGEPLFYLLGLGYGLGTLVPAVHGVPYLLFVAPGLMISSVMYSTTIEATYGTFTKMEHQKVYASMILSPLTFTDIVLGEMLWAVTKGLVSGSTILVLLLVFRAVPAWPGVLGLLLVAFSGLLFSSLAMIVTSLARSYDFFNYYFTLFIAPMFFFSGIFFPVGKLGPFVESLSWVFPLTHLVNLSRLLLSGVHDGPWAVSLLWLTVFTAGAFLLAGRLLERRFMP